MKRSRTKMVPVLAILLLAGVIGSLISGKGVAGLYNHYLPLIFSGNGNNNVRSGYVVLAWNDLGMHCYNRNFQDLGVLPPYNNLWAQVVKVGDPPQIITSGIEVTYEFPNNTYSVGKSDFWTYAQQLFGLTSPLPANIGLTGKGLSGTMDKEPNGDHFKVEGIPLTEFQDTAPTTPYPYQLATVIVRDAQTKVELARTITVSPVSTEMHCDTCHKDGGVKGITTGRVETNILTLHDQENMTKYPAGHTGALMNRRPVLCAECHASNALGKPGVGNLPNFSKAMHGKHKDKVSADMNGCYQCHPGPQTQCLRDVMFQKGMNCIDCHGTLAQVSQNPNPWLNEPKCTTCHPSIIQDQPLYRQSIGHKGIRCAACHDSPHAIAPTNQANDAIKFLGWQEKNGPLTKCTVCHLTQPTKSMPHGK
jgi:hypothetical protein